MKDAEKTASAGRQKQQDAVPDMTSGVKPDASADMTPDMTFDEAFSLLRGEAEKIGSDDISLEDAIESYRRGKAYYEFCRKKLDEAEQTIRIFDRESGELKERKADRDAEPSE